MTKQRIDARESGCDRPVLDAGLVPSHVDVINHVPANLGEKFREAFQGLRDSLVHLDQRWNDALALNNANLIEKYLSGRFVVLLYFNRAGHGNSVQNASVYESERARPHGVALCIGRIDPGHLIDEHCGDDESVLITNVELVDGPKYVVSSFVRPYFIKEEIGYPGEALLYGSIPAFAAPTSASAAFSRRIGREGRFKFLSFSREREGCFAVTAENGIEGMVKGASKRMDHIADSKNNFSIGCVGHELEQLIASIKVVLDNQSCEVSFDVGVPSGYDLRDVMVGPYQL